MAHYTITIQTLINNGFDFKLNEYPIFDENYRETLNNKILNHYFDAEIGFETAPLFRHYLLAKLNEIMPLYNIMYEKQKDILENIFGNVNLTETFESENSNNKNGNNSTNNSTLSNRTTNSNSSSNSSSNSNSSGNSNMKNLFQDTPQGELDTTSINNQNWATNLTLNENSTSSEIEDTTDMTNSINENVTQNDNGNSTSEFSENLTGTNNYIKKIIGNNGGKYNIELLKEIQNSIINTDIMVINELQDLFMGIF